MKYRIPLFLVGLIYLLFGVNDFDAKKAIVLAPATTIPTFSQSKLEDAHKIMPIEITDAQRKWVDSVYNGMSLEAKIGQLFMVAAYSNKDSIHIKSVDNLITEQQIGGLIFFQGGPYRQATLTNRFQSKSKIPLFIGIDAEWGLSMRLDSTYRYPWNMTLGAIQNNKLIEKLGAQMGEQSKRMGIHFNFAPVIDINTNPKNPIIGNRSFGEHKENVTEKALALMKGLQSQGVFATGKHFPGHGDTDKDSHYTLPTISFDKERINAIELYPYRKLIHKGLASVMVAHLNVPSLEKRPNYPSSISYGIVTTLLQKELGFEGLIFTDALNMKGVSSFKQPGDIDLEAFLAGNDILLFPENVPVAIQKIKEALTKGVLTEKRLEFSVRKILNFKYQAGLNQYKPVELVNLSQEINKKENEALHYELYQEAVTVVKNKDNLLPIKDLEKQKIAYVKLGDDVHSPFLDYLNQYAEVTEITDTSLLGITEKLKTFSLVIIGYHKADGAWKNHDFKENELVWLYEIARTNRVVLDVFAKPYALLPLTTTENLEGLVVSYQNNEVAHAVSAQVLFGAIDSKGKLPVTINEEFKVNHGLTLKKNNRLGFALPENVGMNSMILSRIDLIAKESIDKKIAPGMQVLVARKGKVVYQKAFGYHDYEKVNQVKPTDLYDVASLTKIMATLPLLMQLYDKDLVSMSTKLGDMLPIFKGTDKEKINLKDFLSHYARLQPWIPFYKATLGANKQPLDTYYRRSFSPDFSLQVTENLYLRSDYRDTILKNIAQSKLLPKREYKYSDFTFIILRDFIEKTTGKSLDILVQENFYQSIGAHRTLYNPLRKFDMSVIPPTEVDNYFRHQRIQGYVHDMTAAMNGGVDGHAGLFSNALDMAKMMQLYLQKGYYGGKQFFSKKTFEDFNTCYFCSEGNRRGLGFDKPQLGSTGPTCGCASMTSFGHTGFTGTMAWADPEQELIYIFLSNRTFPDSNATNTLSSHNVRERIQQVIYDAIEK